MQMDRNNQGYFNRLAVTALALAITTTVLLGSLSPAGATLGPA
ncbi:hypothetical protein BH10PSE12_BH10PSE12_17310 [soil metagenome]